MISFYNNFFNNYVHRFLFCFLVFCWKNQHLSIFFQFIISLSINQHRSMKYRTTSVSIIHFSKSERGKKIIITSCWLITSLLFLYPKTNSWVNSTDADKQKRKRGCLLIILRGPGWGWLWFLPWRHFKSVFFYSHRWKSFKDRGEISKHKIQNQISRIILKNLNFELKNPGNSSY